jgi:hypothetical protein
MAETRVHHQTLAADGKLLLNNFWITRLVSATIRRITYTRFGVCDERRLSSTVRGL